MAYGWFCVDLKIVTFLMGVLKKVPFTGDRDSKGHVMRVYRAVLAVDHYDLLADARSVIGRHRNLVLAGEAAIGIELLTLLSWAPVDVAIFSVAVPSHRKREVLRVIAERYPHLKRFFIHHHIPSPSAVSGFSSTLHNTVSGGIPATFTAFNAMGVQSNLFHGQWESLPMEH